MLKTHGSWLWGGKSPTEARPKRQSLAVILKASMVRTALLCRPRAAASQMALVLLLTFIGNMGPWAEVDGQVRASQGLRWGKSLYPGT